MTTDPTCPEGCALTAGVACVHGWRYDRLDARAELDLLETGLAPIADIPDWCNEFLIALLDEEHHGEQAAAARAVGRTYNAVKYWRDKHPGFNEAVTAAVEQSRRSYTSRLSHSVREKALNGWWEETWERNRETGELELTKRVRKFDPKLLMWVVSRRGGLPEVYGEVDPANLGAEALTSFRFKLGDEQIVVQAITTHEAPKAPKELEAGDPDADA